MSVRLDRVTLWKSAWQRCSSGWAGLTRPVRLAYPNADADAEARITAGALQLSLYTTHVSLVPGWEYLGSPSLPPPARRAAASC